MKEDLDRKERAVPPGIEILGIPARKLVKNHATCDTSLTKNGKIIYRTSVYTKELANKWYDLMVKYITLNNIDTLIQ